MFEGPRGESLLWLASADVDMDEAAQRLLEDGADPEFLTFIEDFVHTLDADTSTRDRALLLVERTRLLAERGAANAQTSDRLRADASRMRAGSARPTFDDTSRVLRHELATPITVARTALELLATQKDDLATAEQMLDTALRSVKLASRLLETWSRAEHLPTGRAELSWAEIDLGDLVSECVVDVGAVLIVPRDFEVLAERAVTLPADPDAVRQILFNLLTNAAKFSPEGSPIEVSVTANGAHAEVAVRDRGRGVSPQDATRIFEAGERVDHTAPGSGLGLYVARQLAGAHDGALHLEEVSGGARFILRLPLSSEGWQQSLGRRESAATAHDAGRRDRDAIADARDGELDRREAVATQRDTALGSRETLAHERDAERERHEEDRPLAVHRRRTTGEGGC